MGRNEYNHEMCKECVYRNKCHTVEPCSTCGKANNYQNRKIFKESTIQED